MKKEKKKRIPNKKDRGSQERNLKPVPKYDPKKGEVHPAIAKAIENVKSVSEFYRLKTSKLSRPYTI